MKTFLIKVEVDDEVEFEDVEQILDDSMIVTDVDLMEVYED